MTLQNNPDEADVHFSVAKLFLEGEDNLRRARKHLRTAKRIQPDMEEYARLLADVERDIAAGSPSGTDRCIESADDDDDDGVNLAKGKEGRAKKSQAK